MDTFSAIKERRSVKNYDPEHRMSDAEVHQLMEATLLSPTSFNMQNWRFVVMDHPKQKAALRAAAWNQAQLTDASVAIVIMTN